MLIALVVIGKWRTPGPLRADVRAPEVHRACAIVRHVISAAALGDDLPARNVGIGVMLADVVAHAGLLHGLCRDALGHLDRRAAATGIEDAKVLVRQGHSHDGERTGRLSAPQP